MSKHAIISVFKNDRSDPRTAGDWKNLSEVPARAEITFEDEIPDTVSLVVEGWAARVRQLGDGRRHIIGIILPGELCDHFAADLGGLDHSIQAITRVLLARVNRAEFEKSLSDEPVAAAVHDEDLLREAMERQWLTCLGVKSARERVAHLLCEVYYRQAELGAVEGDECPFPLTQADIGELTGITVVHVNRTLQSLRADGLITYGERRLRIPDVDALAAETEFDPSYLRLSRREA